MTYPYDKAKLRLGFINLKPDLIVFFRELYPFLMQRGIEPIFFTLNPKVRSIMKSLDVQCFPRTLDIKEIALPGDFADKFMNPALKIRYSDKEQQLISRVKKTYSALLDFIEHEKIDALFVWNGTAPEESTAAALASDHEIPILFGENGYLPNTIQIDPQGINNAASIKQHIYKGLENLHIDPQTHSELHQRINLLHSGAKWITRKPKVKAKLVSRIAAELRNFSLDKIRRSLGINKGIPDVATLPKDYIFLPFQVEGDSQLTIHSPLVGANMERFLEVCHSTVQAVMPEYKLVVKLHPENLKRIDYSPLTKKYPDVVILKGGSVCELIEKSQAVITINSTVGFEALTYYKPVITLGNCIYNVPGVVHHAENLEQLPALIKAALTQPVARARIDDLLYYLYANYFGHGSWKNHTPQSYQAVADKIASLLLKEKHGT